MAREWTPPISPPPFDCIGCERHITPTWFPYDAQQKPPLCMSCCDLQRNGMSGLSGVTRGDRWLLKRLAAAIDTLKFTASRMEWEGRSHASK